MEARNLRTGLAIIIGFLFILNYSISYGWDNEKTHVEMTKKAVDYLQRREDIPEALKCEIGQNLSFLCSGARDEDIPTHRSWNHFLPALKTSIYGPLDSSTCDSIQWGFENKICTETSQDYFGLTEILSCFSILPIPTCSFTESDDFSWADAINNPRTEKGWNALGHILHLLQDLAVPDHTRNDPHPVMSVMIEGIPLALDDWGNRIYPLLMPDVNESLKVFNNPEDYLTHLATYIRNNYFSSDTCFAPLLPGPIYDHDDDTYFYGWSPDLPNIHKIAYKGRRYWQSCSYTQDCVYGSKSPRCAYNCDWTRAGLDGAILPEQFSQLGPLAILYTASLIKYYYDGLPPLNVIPASGAPSSPSPSDGATGVSDSPTLVLSWIAGSDKDSSYDVYFGTSSNPPYVGNTSGTSYALTSLDPNTTYYWRVIAKESCGSANCCGNTICSPVWSFSTSSLQTCTYLLSSTSKPFDSTGGNDSITVTTQSGCPWQAINNNSTWITITSGNTFLGTWTVTYTVAANTDSSSRTGTITISGNNGFTQAFTVTQSAPVTPPPSSPLSLTVTSATCTQIPFDPAYGVLKIVVSGTASGPVGATVYLGIFPLGSGQCSAWTDQGFCSRGTNQSSSTAWTIAMGGWTGNISVNLSIVDNIDYPTQEIDQHPVVNCPSLY